MNAPKWVRPVSTVIFMIGLSGLTWSGATPGHISSMLTVGTGILTGIAGLLAAIIGKTS